MSFRTSESCCTWSLKTLQGISSGLAAFRWLTFCGVVLTSAVIKLNEGSSVDSVNSVEGELVLEAAKPASKDFTASVSIPFVVVGDAFVFPPHAQGFI